jgi:tRNA G18 (ribose-2'-O)-methylase SpoU
MENKYTNAVDFFKSKIENRVQPDAVLILAAFELRTPENIGAIIRLAGNLGAEQVFFISEENELNATKIARVAHSSIKNVRFSFLKKTEFFDVISTDFECIAVETAEKATNIFATPLPKKCVLLFGNERYGISQDILDRISKTVFIPLVGKTMSMNVSHAVSVAAFEWGRQHLGLLEIQ